MMASVLIIRTPSQRISDLEVELKARWKVSDLKQHLVLVYPTQPSVSSQRLIYNGRLLQNDWCLKDVLDCVGVDSPVVHLVCGINCDNKCTQDVKATSVSTKSVGSGSKEDVTKTSRSSYNALTGSPSRVAIDAALPAAAATATAPSIGFPVAPCSSSAFALGPSVSMTTCSTTSVSVVRASTPPHAARRSEASSTASSTFSNERITKAASSSTPAENSNSVSDCAGIGALPTVSKQPVDHTDAWIQYQQQLANMHHWLTWQYYAYLQNQNSCQFASSPMATSSSSGQESNPRLAAASSRIPAAEDAQERPRDDRADNAVQRAMAAMEENNDDDNDVDERDRRENWRDHLFTVCRVALFLAFLFTYSTVERFFLVGTFVVLIYVLNAGWLQMVEVVEAVGEEEETPTDGQTLASAVSATASTSSCWYHRLMTVINTLTLFFTTLIPNPPPPVDAVAN